MIVIGLDGKLTGSGYAIGTQDGRLLAAGVALVPKRIRKLPERIEWQQVEIRAAALRVAANVLASLPRACVAELPRIYPGDQNRMDPNDGVDLAALTVGIAYGLASRVLTPTPREWKGTIKKDVHHRRLAKAYPDAIPFVEAVTPSRQHDVWDAIGLYHWGRVRL